MLSTKRLDGHPKGSKFLPRGHGELNKIERQNVKNHDLIKEHNVVFTKRDSRTGWVFHGIYRVHGQGITEVCYIIKPKNGRLLTP